MIKYLSEKDNLKDMIKDGIHIVDFYADWCAPCKYVGKELEKIEDKYDIIKVDIDQFEELADEYKIMSIPGLLFFKDGERKEDLFGFRIVRDIEEKVKKIKGE